MKWVTREKARVDRIACPWLISRFVDREPVFLFVPAGEVMAVAEREQAIPYDVPDVEFGHHGDHCSFDAFLEKYKLDDPALRALALIVRGAGTSQRDLTPSAPWQVIFAPAQTPASFEQDGRLASGMSSATPLQSLSRPSQVVSTRWYFGP